LTKAIKPSPPIYGQKALLRPCFFGPFLFPKKNKKAKKYHHSVKRFGRKKTQKKICSMIRATMKSLKHDGQKTPREKNNFGPKKIILVYSFCQQN